MTHLTPIGIVHSTRSVVEDDLWDQERARIELDPSFEPEALLGLADFSHVMVVFHMDQIDPAKIERGARHPRGNEAWPRVGIFAQRAKNRPNQLGVTVCQIERVDGRTLHVRGLDAIDGTKVLDLKPWVTSMGPRGEVREPAWMGELMARYWA